MDVLQKPSAWFSKFCLRVQSKNCGRNSFLIFRFRFFFGLWVKSFSDFRPKNFKKLTKLTSARPEEHFVTLTFFKKNWTLLDFLQKPLVWFSNLYLKAQSKICGRNSFFLFSFSEVFRILSKLFSDFWPKNFEKLSKLPSTCPEEHFVAWFFFKFWNVSDYLQKHLAWFSKFYLRVQSKNCGKHCFFCFISRFFFEFWAKNFQTFGQKTSKSFQNYLRVQRNSLWLEFFFLKFWIVLDFLQKPSAWFSKFCLRVQSKNCGRNSFLIFRFRFFFRTLSEKFFRLSTKKLQEVNKTNFCAPRGTFCDFNFF